MLQPGGQCRCRVERGVGQSRFSSGLPGRRSDVICVAHFVAEKAHDVLLRAFPLNEKERSDLRLVLIGGDGPERQAVMSLSDSLGLGGKVDVMVDVPHSEVLSWIEHAECLIFPSREELWHRALRRSASESSRLRQRAGGHPRGDRRRIVLMLPLMKHPPR